MENRDNLNYEELENVARVQGLEYVGKGFAYDRKSGEYYDFNVEKKINFNAL